jgi:hypothetical protein
MYDSLVMKQLLQRRTQLKAKLNELRKSYDPLAVESFGELIENTKPTAEEIRNINRRLEIVRTRLCALIHGAFVELEDLVSTGKLQQAFELILAFRELPAQLYEDEGVDLDVLRSRLDTYQRKYRSIQDRNLQDYVAALDEIATSVN